MSTKPKKVETEQIPDYQEQMARNEQLFHTLLKQFRPDLFVLADVIDQNHLNVYILLKFMKQLLKIAAGNGWGKINVFIQEGKVMRMEGVDMEEIRENIVDQSRGSS